MNSLNITFFGSSNVGKTALIEQYIHGRTITLHNETIETTFDCYITDQGKSIKAKINDTSGNAKYHKLKNYHVSTSDILVYVYSVADRNSFVQAQKSISESISLALQPNLNRRPMVVIVANKSDLKHRRTVSAEEGQNLQNSLKPTYNSYYYETSIFDTQSVNNLFNSFLLYSLYRSQTSSSVDDLALDKQTIRREKSFTCSTKKQEQKSQRRNTLLLLFTQKRRIEEH